MGSEERFQTSPYQTMKTFQSSLRLKRFSPWDKPYIIYQSEHIWNLVSYHKTDFPKTQYNSSYVYISVNLQKTVLSIQNLTFPHVIQAPSWIRWAEGEAMFFTVLGGDLVLSAPAFTSVTRRWGSSEAHCLTNVLGKSLSKQSLCWEHCVVCLHWETCLEKSYKGHPKRNKTLAYAKL